MGAVVIYALEQVTGRCFSRSPRSLIPDNLNCRQCSEPSPNILDSMSLSALQACFIAVHAGAGYHGTSKEHTYRAAMQQALQAAAQCLDAGGSSMDAVRSAICVLEDTPVSNAGKGSNLTMSGGVECDASIMAGDGTQAAVGAVPGVTNPISAAHLLAVKSHEPLLCGLVPPTFLAGDAARRWALSQGLSAAPTAEQAHQWLVTDEARSAWQQYRNILEQAAAAQITTMPAPLAASELLPGSKQQHRQQEQQQPQNNKRPHPDAAGAAGIGATNGPNSPTAKRRCTTSTSSAAAEPAANAAGHSSQAAQQPTTAIDAVNSAPQQSNQPATLADVCDTVGAVVVDASGRVAAGVSSGGLALKAEGRVGEAAVIGAGCWAADGTWRSTQRASQSAGLGSSDAADNGQDKGTLPGVGVSTSGVGERIMACTLAKSAAMQLQVEPHCMPTQAAEDVLRTQLLTQPGPWDAGLVAVRVNTNRSDSSSDDQRQSEGSSSSGDSAEKSGLQNHSAQVSEAGVDTALHTPGSGHVLGADATRPPRSGQVTATGVARQQQQQQNHSTTDRAVGGQPTGPAAPVLRVEFVAAFTSPSFAVGYFARNGRQGVLSDVKILRRPQPDTAVGAPTAAASESGVANADLASDSQPPSVTSMEVSCCWP